jgi:hypothetical protein
VGFHLYQTTKYAKLYFDFEFVFYFCEKQEIELSIQQKQELQSTLKKLVYILGDDMLINNLNKSRFKLW